MPVRGEPTSVMVAVEPRVLRWARERASLETVELAKRVGLREKRVIEWERTGKLTLAHLEKVASKTYTPIGYLFLSTPPSEALPIADFRRASGQPGSRPSPNLLDTIYSCQQRQNWYREHLITEGENALPFVGSATLADSPEEVATRIRATIGIETQQRASERDHDAALRAMIEQVEAARILVMRNGVVGNNTHRQLNPTEFRGFALSDEYAPVIFINAHDWVSAKIFTLVHELGHIWLGQSGVSAVDLDSTESSEQFCNAVAAEVLVPIAELRDAWRKTKDPQDEARRLAAHFTVSTMVMMIRAWHARLIGRRKFDALYEAERDQWRVPPEKPGGEGGGDFYVTQGSRLGKRFARALIVSTLEGQTSFTEAFRMLGLKKMTTFRALGHSLGVSI